MNKDSEKVPYLQGVTLTSAWFLKNLQSSAFACWVSFINVCSLLFYTEWYSIKACHLFLEVTLFIFKEFYFEMRIEKK